MSATLLTYGVLDRRTCNQGMILLGQNESSQSSIFKEGIVDA